MSPPPRPRLVADDARAVQCRRKTWRQRIDDYALPEGATVQVRLQAAETLLRFFEGPTVSAGEMAAGGGRSG